MGIWQRWSDAGEETNVAVVGAGFIGRGIVHRLERTPGINPALVVNRSTANGVHAFELAGRARESVVVSDDAQVLRAAVDSGMAGVCPTPEILSELHQVDLVVEATGALDFGARVVLAAIDAGKHVVSMNAELDATIGALIRRRAHRQGVVYTISDGDQPGVLLRHIEFVKGMGFEIAAAVNCKRNLDVHQNPDSSRGYASRDNTSLAMTTAFGDGTKMQIENAVVAHLAGLIPDQRGMHGVQTTLEHACRDIMEASSQRGIVEYTLGGDFGGGVGVIGHADDPEMVQPYMRYSKMGDGPDYFFFRPYHLIHFEIPVTIAEVMLDRRGLGEAAAEPVAEVIAIAKRDLRPGDALDGIGGFTCYGEIDTVNGAEGYLPIGLAAHARIRRPVGQDEPIPLDSIELDESAEIVVLRHLQERSTRTPAHSSAALATSRE
jgi:predicted homoserine dehydrogenase-like protein